MTGLYLDPDAHLEASHTPELVLKILAFSESVLAQLLFICDVLLGRLGMVALKLDFLGLAEDLLGGDLSVALVPLFLTLVALGRRCSIERADALNSPAILAVL